MSELNVYDLDGTIRPGTLTGDVIQFGAAAGFIDVSKFKNPGNPGYEEIKYFLSALAGQSIRVFKELTDKISDEARDISFDWAIERMEGQAKREDSHIIIASHGPDFMVRAFARGLDIVHRGRGSWFHTSGLVFSGRAATLDKQRAATRYMREQNLSRFAFAAGDTTHDLPLLRRAKEAVVVNPTEELTKMAEAENWEVIRTD